jgi:hypothetical protein
MMTEMQISAGGVGVGLLTKLTYLFIQLSQQRPQDSHESGNLGKWTPAGVYPDKVGAGVTAFLFGQQPVKG